MAQGETGKQDSAIAVARRNWPESISRSESLAVAGFARAGFRDPTLVLRWAEIVGPEVARVAVPLKLVDSPSGGVLTLKAEPAASTFLQHETRKLCERMNAYLGRPVIARLRFVPGSIDAPRPARTPPRLVEPTNDDPARRFAGPDRLKSALLALARARQRPSQD